MKKMKTVKIAGLLLLSMVFLSSRANALLTLTINSYTTDEVTFTIGGTLDIDTSGDSPGYIGIKMTYC